MKRHLKTGASRFGALIILCWCNQMLHSTYKQPHRAFSLFQAKPASTPGLDLLPSSKKQQQFLAYTAWSPLFWETNPFDPSSLILHEEERSERRRNQNRHQSRNGNVPKPKRRRRNVRRNQAASRCHQKALARRQQIPTYPNRHGASRSSGAYAC